VLKRVQVFYRYVVVSNFCQPAINSSGTDGSCRKLQCRVRTHFNRVTLQEPAVRFSQSAIRNPKSFLTVGETSESNPICYLAMGSSFVSISGKGFWMRDGVLELWLRLLALHVEEDPDHALIAHKIRDNWLLASRGYFSGCIPNGLEEAVSTPEGRAIVVHAIDSLTGVLKKGPEVMDHRTLNLLGNEGGFFTCDFESEALIQVGNAFLALIAGQIETNASSREFIPGLRIAT
jgi:hypothetical protein